VDDPEREGTSACASDWGGRRAVQGWTPCPEFPDAKPEWLALIVCEEAGEVARAVLKKAQGIRTETDWSKELEKEAADVLVALLALADRFGFDLEQAWAERFFGTVSQRRFASAEPSILNVDGQFYAPTPL
jgi:NTP pyrophosphatase (non-canonical NTP hydrolase)